MTVNNDPRISSSLALLENYRRTVVTTAALEEELTKGIAKRRYAAERKYQNALKDSTGRLTKEITEADKLWKAKYETIRERHAARHLRLEKAERSARREMPKRVAEKRGDWLGRLQRQKLRMEKEVTGKIGSAAASLAGVQQKLAAQEEQLEKLDAGARAALRGSPSLRKMVMRAGGSSAGDETSVDAALTAAEYVLADLKKHPMARLTSLLPVWLVVPLFAAVGGLLIWAGFSLLTGLVCSFAGFAAFLFHMAAQSKVEKAAGELASALGTARAVHSELGKAAAARHAQETAEAQERQLTEAAAIKDKWGQVGDVEAQFLTAAREKLTTQVKRIAERNERWLEKHRSLAEAGHSAATRALEAEDAARQQHYAAVLEQETSALNVEEKEKWDALQSDWLRESTALWQEITCAGAGASRHSHRWDAAFVENWKPAKAFDPVGAFAQLEVDLPKYAGTIPKDPRLPLPGPAQFSLPLALTFPSEGSLLFETNESASAGATDTLNHLALRLLATTPPGRLALTIFDPAGLGAGFAGLMHLADYEDAVINRRIWTQRDHIEERLTELSSHIEKVIQMYLRTDFATIAEYNEQAGSVAEKYHFIIAADFPSGYSDVATKKLLSIATSGARCGVFFFIHWDQRLPRPDGFVAEELRQNAVRLTRQKEHFILSDGPHGPGVNLVLDAPPDHALALDLVHRIGKASIDSGRVQVPFSQISPAPEEMWTGDTTNEVRVAVGRTGATKHQMLAIGKGTRQHALFAGKTGSGKSTLFHVIITNLALSCSPDDVEFYLIDFKKGVEFKCYASHRLPHARVVAIESDREFALSVLQRVDEELKRRGDLFRKLGVQDVAGFKRAGGPGPLPRTLLIIDEFQEFFVEDDTIAQTASLLFDRIVRQGRAFGIHVLLGSQTLGGAYSLARATLGQMVIRVALQCNEADAYLIMDDGNSAPRLLSRPGEGIYNDAAGAVEGNSPFQVCWLPDQERDQCLERITALAKARGDTHGAPIVFEGNAPADIAENDLLATVLRRTPTAPPPFGRCWLGAPNSIKGPTEATFYRQSGNHLLIVGQRDEAALNMIALSARALASQYPVGTAQFYFLHSAPPGTQDAEFIEQLGKSMPHGFTEVRTQEVPALIDKLATELKARSSGEIQADTAPAIFVFIHQLHRFKKLRQEDDFRFGGEDAGADTGSQFNEIITEGSSLGIHLIPTVDTFNNVNRSMNRKALSEFEMRVVFQMSANDSSSLIDTPAASTLGLHRSIFYNEQAGTLETFRPYAEPPESWWLGQ